LIQYRPHTSPDRHRARNGNIMASTDAFGKQPIQCHADTQEQKSLFHRGETRFWGRHSEVRQQMICRILMFVRDQDSMTGAKA
jgi:hypothetical protein